MAAVAKGCARSAFERPAAVVGDLDASYPDLASAHPHVLTTRHSEPIVDQVGYHFDAEPMGQQHRPGAAAQAYRGKYFERAALFRTAATLS
jgi:hypothetical protein